MNICTMIVLHYKGILIPVISDRNEYLYQIGLHYKGILRPVISHRNEYLYDNNYNDNSNNYDDNN